MDLTKRERRDRAREKARHIRDQQVKSERRARWFIQGGVLLAIFAVVSAVVLVIVFSVPSQAAGPRNMVSDGIVFGPKGEPILTGGIHPEFGPTPYYESAENGKINIRVYSDYSCHYCKQFEETTSAYLSSLLDGGNATLSIHPIAIFGSGLNRYSVRATNAVACVANYSPKYFLSVNAALFQHQESALQNRGLGNDELWTIASASGASDPKVEECIKHEMFSDWAVAATERATRYILPNSDNVSLRGTPTVLVNGALYTGSPGDLDSFKRFIAESQGKTFSTKPPSHTGARNT